MATEISAAEFRKLRVALAQQAYESNHVRLFDPDITACDCLVASRQGLFGVTRTSARLIAYGMYFGLAVHGNHIYLFEACDRPHSWTMKGRVIRLTRHGTELVDAIPLITGLDNGCHHIKVIDNRLCIVDTHHQIILRYTLGGAFMNRVAPIPPARADDLTGCYVHMNSLAEMGDQIGIVLHNGALMPERNSELLVLDRQWHLVERHTLAGRGCHDILVRADGSLLHCGSYAGELIGSRGEKVKLCDAMTRGLAATQDAIMIGITPYAAREERGTLPGRVIYLDHALKPIADIVLPGAPVDILAL